MVYVVNFDIDNVCYEGISTSHVADRSTADVGYHLQRFLDKGWFNLEDLGRWSQEYNQGNSPKLAPDVARCLTDFFYKMKKPGTAEPVITKQQIIEGKQGLLGGISMSEIRAIAQSVPWSEGLLETVEDFKIHGLYLFGSSDGLGPFVCYQMKRLGFDDKGYVPTLIDIEGRKEWFREHMLAMPDAKLTGEVGKYDKAQVFFEKMDLQNIPLSSVAAIDDSGANVESLLLPIQQAGGIAVGYNPTDAHRPTFEKHSIPILKGTDLKAFGELVLNRSTLGQYCE